MDLEGGKERYEWRETHSCGHHWGFYKRGIVLANFRRETEAGEK